MSLGKIDGKTCVAALFQQEHTNPSVDQVQQTAICTLSSPLEIPTNPEPIEFKAIKDLPSDIFVAIFVFLGEKTILNLKVVCKNWNLHASTYVNIKRCETLTKYIQKLCLPPKNINFKITPEELSAIKTSQESKKYVLDKVRDFIVNNALGLSCSHKAKFLNSRAEAFKLILMQRSESQLSTETLTLLISAYTGRLCGQILIFSDFMQIFIKEHLQKFDADKIDVNHASKMLYKEALSGLETHLNHLLEWKEFDMAIYVIKTVAEKEDMHHVLHDWMERISNEILKISDLDYRLQLSNKLSMYETLSHKNAPSKILNNTNG